jgi:hypothetical protein
MSKMKEPIGYYDFNLEINYLLWDIEFTYSIQWNMLWAHNE